MSNLIEIGFTKKPHGIKGEIKLQVSDNYLEDLLETDIVMIDLKGKATPFFVEQIRVGNNIIAKFEDVDTPEAALSLAHKTLFLRPEDILEDAEREMPIEKMPYSQCISYVLFGGDKKIGTIENLIEYPQQMMAVVSYQSREILVPLNPAFVVEVNDNQKLIKLDLPEGILEL